jgi:hypothetical protein
MSPCRSRDRLGYGEAYRGDCPTSLLVRIEIQLVGVVVEGEQLGVAAPLDGGVELLGAFLLTEVVAQLVEEEGLGDPLVVVFLQRLEDPEDGRLAQDAAGDEAAAMREVDSSAYQGRAA